MEEGVPPEGWKANPLDSLQKGALFSCLEPYWAGFSHLQARFEEEKCMNPTWTSQSPVHQGYHFNWDFLCSAWPCISIRRRSFKVRQPPTRKDSDGRTWAGVRGR